MTTLRIPINTDIPDQEFPLELEGVTYVFRFRFNFRGERWSMSISDRNGTLIIGGIPLVLSVPLTRKFKDPRLPPGEFFIMDTTGDTNEPGEGSFGTTHQLLYKESGS